MNEENRWHYNTIAKSPTELLHCNARFAGVEGVERRPTRELFRVLGRHRRLFEAPNDFWIVNESIKIHVRVRGKQVKRTLNNVACLLNISIVCDASKRSRIFASAPAVISTSRSSSTEPEREIPELDALDVLFFPLEIDDVVLLAFVPLLWPAFVELWCEVELALMLLVELWCAVIVELWLLFKVELLPLLPLSEPLPLPLLLLLCFSLSDFLLAVTDALKSAPRSACKKTLAVERKT